MFTRIAIRSVLARQASVRAFHISGACYRLVTEVVPPLGESITEGTIAKWMKNEGDSVNADDVVLVVETDKVTVDIKATLSGKIIRRLVDSDNVVVGKPLYEIDAVGDGAAVSAAPVAGPTSSATSATTISTSEHGHKRQPRIKFIGKRSREKKDAGHHVAAPSTPATTAKITSHTVSAAKVKNHHPSSKDFFDVKDKAWFGRPKLSAKEILAIESGGAL